MDWVVLQQQGFTPFTSKENTKSVDDTVANDAVLLYSGGWVVCNCHILAT